MNNLRINKHRKGMITILNVVVIGGFMLGMMAIAYKASIRSMEGQRKVQLQLDYEAREQAFLRSIVTLAPQYAANSMIDTSANAVQAANSSFDSMYFTAQNWSRMAIARSAADYAALPFTAATHRNGNTGDASNPGAYTAIDYIGINGGVTPSGVGRAVVANSGYPVDQVFARAGALVNPVTQSQITPLISSDIAYSAGQASGSMRDFKFIDYPDIHFGYTSGQFIARRNWWSLNMHAGSSDRGNTNVGAINNDGSVNLGSNEYVLSIYEVPSQLAISSSALTELGTINGADWNASVNIVGSVYAKGAVVGGGRFNNIATTEGATVAGATTTIGGATTATQVTAGNLSNREQYEADNNVFYPISQASSHARTLFLPINPGMEFFDSFASVDTTQVAGQRLSKESWNNYTRGCHQCAMKLTVIESVSVADQTPLAFDLTYTDSAGTLQVLTIHKPSSSFSGGITWVEDGIFPFEITTSADATPQLEVYIDRLIVWLDSIDPGGAAVDFGINHSLVVNVDYAQATVVDPSASAIDTDLSLGIRGCNSLIAFTQGFSLVTNLRLYILSDLNQVGTASGSPAFPPLSVFAPSIRYGDGGLSGSIEFNGRVGSLNTNSATGINPIEMKRSGQSNASAAGITANLTALTALNELPPINMMNWLVVIEKKL